LIMLLGTHGSLTETRVVEWVVWWEEESNGCGGGCSWW